MTLITPLTAFGPQIVPPGPADHFDPVDIVHQRVLHFPIGAIEERGIDGAAIDQHQHRPRQTRSKTANPDGPLVPVDARHFDARRQPQRFGNAGCAGTPDVVAGDDVDRRRSLKSLFGFLGESGDVDLRQLLQAHGLVFRETGARMSDPRSLPARDPHGQQKRPSEIHKRPREKSFSSSECNITPSGPASG